MLSEDFLEAMKKGLKKYGSQKAFSQATGIHQSRISDYANGHYDFENLSIGTLHKLFPNMRIVYFPEEQVAQTSDQTLEIINARIQAILQRLSPAERVLKCWLGHTVINLMNPTHQRRKKNVF